MLDPLQGPYSKYNARRSTPAQVARDFVPPDRYYDLTDTVDPQLIVGPRGIGKTTLLKMLLPEALDSWRSREAARARDKIRFTGVFVAADKMWAGQFDQLTGAINPESEKADLIAPARTVFARAAFAYMALSAFADAAAYRCRRDGDGSRFRWVALPPADEEKLVAEVAPAWVAHPATSTFSALVEQMQDNLSELGQLMQDAAKPGMSITDINLLLRNRILSVHFPTAAKRFIEAFNRCVGNRDDPWVLLIDEFEFLPPAARTQIGEALQGGDPRLSYKISLAPYTGFAPFAGTPLNDWEKIQLTQPYNRSKDNFTSRLFAQQLGTTARPEKMLTGFGFDDGPKDTYDEASRNVKDIERLASFDASFEKWLDRLSRGEPIAVIARSPKRLKALREAMPIVRLRLEYYKSQADDSRGVKRPRHRFPERYGGVKNLYAMSEGNPRWIKALAHALLDERKGGSQTISPAAQARAITRVSERLYNNLKASSIETSSGIADERLRLVGPSEAGADFSPYTDLSPASLLTLLGEYLKAHTHGRFSLDIPAAFEIDDGDDWLREILNSLIFLGAIIVEKRTSQAEHYADPHAEFDIIRLARMWAPIFELLPRTGSIRSLHAALRFKARKQRRRALPGQESLAIEEHGGTGK